MENQTMGGSPLITVKQEFINSYNRGEFDAMGLVEFEQRLNEVLVSERPTFSFADGMRLLVEKLQTEPDYYLSWQANMAMAFQDTYFERSCMSPNHSKTWMNETGNIAAQKFLDLLIK